MGPEDKMESNNNNNENTQNQGDLDTRYNPHGLEKKWYQKWESTGAFSWKNQKNAATPEAPSTFSMVIPPPNVTGSLHLGHALNHTVQDILARYHRMKGDLTLWVPGTDHAGIATQNVVEKLLANENSNRWDLGREKFEERVWQWKAESGGMITHQQRELGESVDWSYERFTMDEGLSKTVVDVFISLYKEGLIYQGERIINWCPHCVTALSNIEVEYAEKKGKFYHIRYPLLNDGETTLDDTAIARKIDAGEYLEIATTRPETMLGDEALAVHPEDERYKKYAGKKVFLPLVGKAIPVVADDFVDKDFGTGVVKITPAHDPNDFEVGRRHNLPVTRILDDHGRTNELAGSYAGLSREKARDQIVADLEEKGFLREIEEMKHSVGGCYRCQTIVEPISSLQWFVKVKPLAEKAIEVVKDGSIQFVPKRWENTYFEWMNNIQDWCISRQLWWGHRIPAYICQNCKEVHVAESAPAKCQKCDSTEIKQDEDVLDTWFSSALWPFSTLIPPEEASTNSVWPVTSEELKLFYPTSVLVTGFDIIFFWVARMIMMGTHFQKAIPFEKVYIHGLVRDAERKKMSKSKGNVVNPLEKMGEYGTDAFRFFMVSILPEGKDIIYDESRLKGYSAFCNKVWNTARFIRMNLPEGYVLPESAPGAPSPIDGWIIEKFNRSLKQINGALDSMRFSEYAQTIYDFIWKEFCDNYVELSKTSLKDETTQETTRYYLSRIFLDALKLLHPVMPFITEELFQLWNKSGDSKNEKLIMTDSWPVEIADGSPETLKQNYQLTEDTLSVIYKVRYLRGELGIAPGEKFDAHLQVAPDYNGKIADQKGHIVGLARLNTIGFSSEPGKGIRAPIALGTLFIDCTHLVDNEKEKARLGKELENQKKYLEGIERKLSNEGFVKNAPPEILEEENSKKEAAGKRVAELEELIRFF